MSLVSTTIRLEKKMEKTNIKAIGPRLPPYMPVASSMPIYWRKPMHSMRLTTNHICITLIVDEMVVKMENGVHITSGLSKQRKQRPQNQR
jgi:hypothetical protein